MRAILLCPKHPAYRYRTLLQNQCKPQAVNTPPTCQGQVGAEEEVPTTSNLPVHTHSTSNGLLPRFRKVVARSTIPDGQENENNSMDAIKENEVNGGQDSC